MDAAKVKKTMEVMNMMPFYPANYTAADIATAADTEGKTEMDAMIAYLQSLGNHIKFTEGVNYRD